MQKITVLANCHSLPISRIVASRARDVDVTFIDVNQVGHPVFAERVQAMEDDDGSGLVFTFPLSEAWGGLQTSRLRSVYADRLYSFTNVHFSGLHPDITYLGVMGARVPSVMGDYHSRLILFCFVNGLSVQDCVDLFRGDIYQRLGYFDAFSLAQSELLRRDEFCDVPFGERFLQDTRRRLTLYTVNHPTNAVLSQLVDEVMRKAGLQTIDFPAEYLPHSLSENYIWPIYPEISEHHALPYQTPFFFLKQGADVGRVLDLQDLVQSAYQAYSGIGLEALKAEVVRLSGYAAFQEAVPHADQGASGGAAGEQSIANPSEGRALDEGGAALTFQAAFERYVLRNNGAEPAEIARALAPFQGAEGGEGAWIRFNLSLAYYGLGRLSEFDAVSKRFCFTDATQYADFRVAKIEVLRRRIKYLKSLGEPLDREAVAFLKLAPMSGDLAVLSDTQYFTALFSNFTFDADAATTLPSDSVSASWRAKPISIFHDSSDTRPAMAPVVKSVDNVEYLFVNGDDAVFRDDRVYSELCSSEAVGRARAAMKTDGSLPTVLGGAMLLLTDYFPAANYCHWTYDWFPRLLIARAMGERIDYVCVRDFPAGPNRRQLELYCAEHKIEIINSKDPQWLTFDRVLTVDNALIAATHAAWQGCLRVVELIREAAGAALPQTPASGRRLYISRDDASSRRVSNEDEVMAMLARFDFEKVVLTGMSIAEQAELFASADVCIGAHGAGLTNIVHMPAGSTVIELFHWQGGTSAYTVVARALDHRYFYLACGVDAADIPDGNIPFISRSEGRHSADLWVDTALLEQWLLTEVPASAV